MTKRLGKKIVFLATGGTIAGLSADAGDNVAYTAAQVGVAQLLQTLPAHVRASVDVVGEQVAQVDSKDMSTAVWSALALRCRHWLDDAQVLGIVVTHGTDTMEETAYFLHALLARTGGCGKPLVLTGAMRPASALVPDGPQNMHDALAVAADRRLRGVLVVFAGQVHGACHVHKQHPYRLDAFTSGEAGVVGVVEEGHVRLLQAGLSEAGEPLPDEQPSAAAAQHWRDWMQPDRVWPRVEIVSSHAAADGWLVDAMVRCGAETLGGPVRGIVVAGTGNGSVHQALEHALLRAQAAGIVVRRASRCAGSRMVANPSALLPDADGLSPVQARISLMLDLLAIDEATQDASPGRVRPVP